MHYTTECCGCGFFRVVFLILRLYKLCSLGGIMVYRRLDGHHFKPLVCASEGCKKITRSPYMTTPDGSVYCSRACYEKR